MNCKNRCSKLKHKLELLSKTSTSGAGGISTETWSVQETFWASIEPKKKNALYEALGKSNQVTHIIMARYTSNMDVKKRIRFGSRHFFIRSFINIDECSKYLEIEAVENVKANVTVT